MGPGGMNLPAGFGRPRSVPCGAGRPDSKPTSLGTALAGLGGKPAKLTTPAVLAIVAVVAAAACGFAADAYWVASTNRPAPSVPPQIIPVQTVEVPAANYTASFAATAWGYWNSGYVGDSLTLVYDASFPVDACLYDWPRSTPVLQDNFTDCASQPGAFLRADANGGALSFPVPSQPDNGFTFSALDPHEAGGRVNYTWYLNTSADAYVTGGFPSNLTLPPGQMTSVYDVYVDVPLPAGYTRVSVAGDATGPVTPVFILLPHNGYAGTGTAWNYTGPYQGPETMVVRLESALLRPVSVSLAVAVSNG